MIKGSRWKQVNKVKKNVRWWARSFWGNGNVPKLVAVMVTQLHKSKKKNH